MRWTSFCAMCVCVCIFVDWKNASKESVKGSKRQLLAQFCFDGFVFDDFFFEKERGNLTLLYFGRVREGSQTSIDGVPSELWIFGSVVHSITARANFSELRLLPNLECSAHFRLTWQAEPSKNFLSVPPLRTQQLSPGPCFTLGWPR